MAKEPITLKDLDTYRSELREQFGDATLAYGFVTQTQLSIARYYGGVRVNGKPFTYNPEDDSLIRDDAYRYIRKLKNKQRIAKEPTQQVEQMTLYKREADGDE